MRSISLVAAAIALGGCAASSEIPVISGSFGTQAGFGADGQAQAGFVAGARTQTGSEADEAQEEFQIADVIELPSTSNPNVNQGAECYDTYMTGSRIRRTRCDSPQLEATKIMEEQRIRWDLEYVREMAEIQRQVELQQRLEERARREASGPGL